MTAELTTSSISDCTDTPTRVASVGPADAFRALSLNRPPGHGVVGTALAHVFDTGQVTGVEYSNVVKPGQVPMGGMGAIPVIARLVLRRRDGGMVAGQSGPLDGGCGSRRV